MPCCEPELALVMQLDRQIILVKTTNPFAAASSNGRSRQQTIRERFRNTVFAVLAAHMFGLMVMLLGCNTDPVAEGALAVDAPYPAPVRSEVTEAGSTTATPRETVRRPAPATPRQTASRSS
jgi:hypothetical protein